MSDMAPTNGNAALPGLLPGGIEPEDPSRGVNALLVAIRVMAEKAAIDPSAQEAADYANAALHFAQAVVVLDPETTAEGVPLEHQHDLEQVRQDGMQALEKVRQAAAAPTPTKKRRIRRTSDGGMEIEG